MPTEPSPSPLQDPAVHAALDEIYARSHRPSGGGPRQEFNPDPFAYPDVAFPIHRDQGDLIYFLCRAIGATRAVEFATSLGVSTLYFAAAIRDNLALRDHAGAESTPGAVIGSEIVPEKAAAAEASLAAAGLADLVDIRVGDARETLKDLGRPVDVALIDGFPTGPGPTLALQVMQIIAPQVRVGGIVFNDNAEADYLDYVRDPAHGFVNLSVPIKGSTEVSLKVSS